MVALNPQGLFQEEPGIESPRFFELSFIKRKIQLRFGSIRLGDRTERPDVVVKGSATRVCPRMPPSDPTTPLVVSTGLVRNGPLQGERGNLTRGWQRKPAWAKRE